MLQYLSRKEDISNRASIVSASGERMEGVGFKFYLPVSRNGKNKTS